MEFWLVYHDISDPKRLRRVARACEDYGLRRQYSVFLVRVTPTAMARLRARLYEIIDHAADQVEFLPLCRRCVAGIESMGRLGDPHDSRDVVVVV